MRDTTETRRYRRGTLKLAGTDEDTIYSLTNELLTDPVEYEKMAKAHNPYGDGHASRYIVEALMDYLAKN